MKKAFKGYKVVCDKCGADLVYDDYDGAVVFAEDYDLAESILNFYELGWDITAGGEHVCPDCNNLNK